MNRKRRNEDTNSRNTRFHSRVIDDRDHSVPNIMKMSKEERLNFIRTSRNPYGWPLEYLDIYTRESRIRNPPGYSFLKDITKEKVFQPLDDQVVSKVVVKQMKNVNCIKSRQLDNYDVYDMMFSNDLINHVRKTYGIIYYNNGEEYYNNDDIYDNMEYEEYCKSTISPYQMVIEAIKYALDERYHQYVCLAGGFSLSKYFYDNYDMNINFGDIDIFIHGCDEATANQISTILTKLTGNPIYYNDNVMVSSNDSCYDEYEMEQKNPLIYFQYHPKSFQVIKRLYTSPAQIVLGFDVDCCCLLTNLSGQTFASERCCYAIRNGYNMVNFLRMSPSYEYRLVKYNKRGFAIWVPFIEHFKENAVFDFNHLDPDKMSSVIIKSLIKEAYKKKGLYVNVLPIEERVVSDYLDRVTLKEKGFIRYNNNYQVFKTLNPAEQIINTFHRIVLEDPIAWYPVRSPQVLDYISINDLSTETIELTHFIYKSDISAMNVMRSRKKSIYVSQRSLDKARNFVNYIESLLPGVYIIGDLIRSYVTGSKWYGVNICHDKLVTKEDKLLIRYKLDTYLILDKIKNSIAAFIPEFYNINPFELGRVRFNIEKELKVDQIVPYDQNFTDEDNFRNYVKIDFNKIYVTPYNLFNREEGNKPDKVIFSYKDQTIMIPYQDKEEIDRVFNEILVDFTEDYRGTNNKIRSISFIRSLAEIKFKSVTYTNSHRLNHAFIPNQELLTIVDSLYSRRNEMNLINPREYDYNYAYYYNLSQDLRMEIEQQVNLYRQAIEAGDYKTANKMRTFERFQHFISDNYFNDTEYIRKVFTTIQLRKSLRKGDPDIFRMIFMRKMFSFQARSVISFPILDDNLIRSDFVYNNGKVYSSPYDIKLAELNLESDDIGDTFFVYDEPTWTQFITY